jgi:hypothetical protein
MHNTKFRFNLFQIEQEIFENHKNFQVKKFTWDGKRN